MDKDMPVKIEKREKRHKGSVDYGRLVNKVEQISQEAEQRLENRRENIRKSKNHFLRLSI